LQFASQQKFAINKKLYRNHRRNPKESRVVEQLKHPAKPNHFWAVVIAQGGKQAVEYAMADEQAR